MFFSRLRPKRMPAVRHRLNHRESRDDAEHADQAPVGRTTHETVQVTQHDREPLHFASSANTSRISSGSIAKHTFGRPTIIADINAMHRSYLQDHRRASYH